MLFASPVLSDDEQANSKQAVPSQPVVSIDGLTDLSQANAATLGMAAYYADRNGDDPDKAIVLYRKAIEKDNNDIDLHLRYAELLEYKFNREGESDSQLYNDCVREWLIVLRNEAGDEKGLTFHGIGLPLSGTLYGDEHRVILARKHLVSLTGIAPKAWETDAQYLQRAAKRASVRGKLLSKSMSNKATDQ
jgi:hypothetical protein